ncbi:AAA ATPase [Rivularia sp. IAM M-261]|nr:AAA ATPase [Rivularia sp. IAM M-261]
MTRYTFYAKPENRPNSSHSESPAKPEPYIADLELIQAVNLAIYLRRPLLLEGEAGCGKTRLASAVAYELGLPFYRWDIRSTSKAQDGLYTYDAIRRLHDVQVKQLDPNLSYNPSDATNYRKFGALGKAFNCKEYPAVVLIDEIDKADLDFPNDLLTVLDREQEFTIPETNETIKPTPGNEPIVIITSNKEKGNLPAPFLRRCIYYFVPFPNNIERLQEIVNAHYHNQKDNSPKIPPSTKLVEAAAEKFLEIRNAGGLFKNPGTSEFLDWIEALQNFASKPFTASELKQSKRIIFPELLFKLRADLQKYVA